MSTSTSSRNSEKRPPDAISARTASNVGAPPAVSSRRPALLACTGAACSAASRYSRKRCGSLSAASRLSHTARSPADAGRSKTLRSSEVLPKPAGARTTTRPVPSCGAASSSAPARATTGNVARGGASFWRHTSVGVRGIAVAVIGEPQSSPVRGASQPAPADPRPRCAAGEVHSLGRCRRPGGDLASGRHALHDADHTDRGGARGARPHRLREARGPRPEPARDDLGARRRRPLPARRRRGRPGRDRRVLRGHVRGDARLHRRGRAHRRGCTLTSSSSGAAPAPSAVPASRASARRGARSTSAAATSSRSATAW